MVMGGVDGRTSQNSPPVFYTLGPLPKKHDGSDVEEDETRG